MLASRLDGPARARGSRRPASRSVPQVVAALMVVLGVGALAPARAAADLGTVELHAGALRLDEGTRVSYRPVLRGGLAFEVVGPLHLGAYVQLTGYELPLRVPQPGGGLYLSVRPRFEPLRVRPSVDASFGFVRLPAGQLEEQALTESTRTFVVSAAGSLGASVSEAVTLELRLEYSHYFATEADASLGGHALALLAGVTIHVP